MSPEPGASTTSSTGRLRRPGKVGPVDDLANPRAVIIRSGARYRSRRHYMYATSDRAAEALLAELPRNWKLMFAASPSRLVKVVRKFRKLDFVRLNYLYVLEPDNS